MTANLYGVAFAVNGQAISQGNNRLIANGSNGTFSSTSPLQ